MWVVVPARYGATRLPGKPLAPIGDLPMIEHVRRRAVASGAERVIVATDDARIAGVVRAYGGECVVTGPAASGTHRVRLALDALGDWPAAVVNVQGDQPLLDPSHVAIAAGALSHAPVATLSAPFDGDPSDPHRVKVVTDPAGTALYFSRAPIPWRGPWRQHVGVYAFTAGGLRAATDAPRSPLCASEDLEQLAWLEAGIRIAVREVDRAPPGVDTPAQLDEARRLLGV